MIKSTDIFKLEKWWGKGITLIVAALVLAGCQSQAIPSIATATPTPTEIPATATFTPTNTPEPTATATELVLPDNAVRIVGGGYVYVENGKPILLGTEGIKVIEDISAEVIFSSGEDALAIFDELFKAELENQEQLHNDLLLDGPTDTFYRLSIEQSLFSTGEQGEQQMQVTGIPIAFAWVESPVDSTDYPQIGIAYLKVFGYEKLFPLVVGAFDKKGNFQSLLGSALQYPRKTTNVSDCTGQDCKAFVLTAYNWNNLQQLLNGNIMSFRTLFAVPTDRESSYYYELYGRSVFSPSLTDFIQKLTGKMAKEQASAGNKYLEQKDLKWQTGSLLSGLEAELGGQSSLLGLVLYTQFRLIQFK